MADGNTLFNVAQRLGGSIGISLLITFFSIRESSRITEALQALGLPLSIGQSGPGSSVSHLPSFVRARLADAVVSGFHDTIWLLIVGYQISGVQILPKIRRLLTLILGLMFPNDTNPGR